MNELFKNNLIFFSGILLVVFGLLFAFLIFPLGGILVLLGLGALIISIFKKKGS
jgi:uncharacterized membrane protein YgdD (TMEM256/DUF423 family)